jgi:glycosyltransferase involved in cell wall biosynthesis
MDRCPEKIKEAIRKYLSHPNIIFIEKYMQRSELNGLLNIADCYFSMHRSEGFGLPIAESMYLGKPVIATGWSSNMDFMNINNSLPLQYKLIELDRDYGPYTKGNVWAEPDIDHAAHCLLKVYNDKKLRSKVGSCAADDIRRDYSPSSVGQKIQQRLEIIDRQ